MSRSGFTQGQFDDALAAMVRERQESGAEQCRIVARDLHRSVVGGSQPNRMPMACNAMWKLADTVDHTVVHRTASGRSSSLEIEYCINAGTISGVPSELTRRHSEPPCDSSPSRLPSARRLAAITACDKAELPDADLYLVACVKRKTSTPMPARDLYASPWFRKARACVERTGRPWAILSAKHGLVWPTDTVAPYEKTLQIMSSPQRRQWADAVMDSLAPHLAGVRTITMLAGNKYRQLLMRELQRRGIEVLVPMEGLSQGRQLQWLGACLNRPAVDRGRQFRPPQTATGRVGDLKRFYDCLEHLEGCTGGARRLSACSSRMAWPERGVYFFMEPGEMRSHSGRGLRVVRVGTHGLKPGAKSTLWKRLAQHRGTTAGGGNHRTSIFRLIVGTALIARDDLDCPTWNDPRSRPAQSAKSSEQFVEGAVSTVIGRMPFLWLSVPDEPGRDSKRGYIERNAISLLSNRCGGHLDPPSHNWLGHHCDRDKVRTSGLWNSDHVDETYDPAFLHTMERLAEQFIASS